ncbi:hypothetical protein, conserved in T. vivax [Trypanosoma vivax Y486]|uniref:Uncharacterized protein n=1 Tax=Trypanosoma vivax (strain Y486) TaxID=1055687 RepID=F9WM07_TRYVY|nr:hypothetical protein, conserved in T. vivax [Trypanosoma vivax Y486]|eukprot:CCD18555.1 hypothetical protein, conserved in T. vivax [Trypanosoma vivax Y486]
MHRRHSGFKPVLHPLCTQSCLSYILASLSSAWHTTRNSPFHLNDTRARSLCRFCKQIVRHITAALHDRDVGMLVHNTSQAAERAHVRRDHNGKTESSPCGSLLLIHLQSTLVMRWAFGCGTKCCASRSLQKALHTPATPPCQPLFRPIRRVAQRTHNSGSPSRRAQLLSLTSDTTHKPSPGFTLAARQELHAADQTNQSHVGNANR